MATTVLSPRIDLAHEPELRLGRLTVDPPLRQVRRDDGASEVVEPRVMQVLVALMRADGAIVSRDDLTRCCWDGRIVGDDAINRVLSRLRRLADGIGAGEFRIETVTKVGYRLVADGGRAEPAPIIDRGHETATIVSPPTRRMLIGAASALVAISGIGSWALLRDGGESRVSSPEVAALLSQGLMAFRQVTSDGNSQAIALFERVTTLEPDNADGWGLLALIYALESHVRARNKVAALEERSRSAAARALVLDPGNAYARQSRAALIPRNGTWREAETISRGVLRDHPGNDSVMIGLANVLSAVGRMRESASLLDEVIKVAPPGPGPRHLHALALWGAGRVVEADRAIAESFQLFPRHFAVWYSRFYYLMYTGRSAEAIAMGEDREGWPAGTDASQTAWIIDVARGMETRAPVAIDHAIEETMTWARKGVGYAQNGLQFASALGRLDQAFALAEAYLFNRGFVVPDIRFLSGQGTYTRVEDRHTAILFMPSTRAMRGDPRFGRLTEELGLERYWRESGTRPDYRIGTRG